MGKRSRASRRQESEAAAAPLARAPMTKQGKWNGVDVPDVSDADCAFPTRWRELLPPMEVLSSDERNLRGPFCDALSSLFYSGGRLADHGIKVRDGHDASKVMRYIRATLGDFGPRHEHKIGGIAHALAKWCTISSSASKR